MESRLFSKKRRSFTFSLDEFLWMNPRTGVVEADPPHKEIKNHLLKRFYETWMLNKTQEPTLGRFLLYTSRKIIAAFLRPSVLWYTAVSNLVGLVPIGAFQWVRTFFASIRYDPIKFMQPHIFYRE